MKMLMLVLLMSTVVSCSDASKGRLFSIGEGRNIKCYSGGVLIYEGKTTGMVQNETNSDGYYFTDTNGEYIEINAECIFRKTN